MTEVSKFCGQEALIDLGSAWKRFFKGLAKHPRFHRYNQDNSFRCSGNVFIGRDFVQLPTLGRIKLREKDYIKIPRKYRLQWRPYRWMQLANGMSHSPM